MKRLLLTGATVILSLLSATPAVAAVPTARPADTTCAETVYFYSYRGERMCGTSSDRRAFFDDGTTDNEVEREWVIGTNGEIYNIVFDHHTGVVSGWKSLGGQGRQYVSLDTFVNSHNLTIQTVGTNGHPYCDDLAATGWNGWYRCG